MSINSWIILVDERRAGGMLDAAKKMGGQVTAIVVASRALAECVAGMGFDKVLLFETAPDVPAEALVSAVAEAAEAAGPGLVLSSDAAGGRVLLGVVAAKLDAVLLSSVRALALKENGLLVSRAAADGRVLEDIVVQGVLAAIFDGDDVQADAAPDVAIESMNPEPDMSLSISATIEAGAESAGLLTAARVLAVGMGLGNRNNVPLIEELAAALNAEIACTLPVCDDMRWFPAERVIGSSHNQIAPELYIGVGISGQPQHVSGIRDAKIVVAINNDPEARFFKNCDYGILGDLNEIVPALTQALKK